MELKPVYMAEDGTVFSTKAEAVEHARRPAIHAAMMAITDANGELSDWLIENSKAIAQAFDTGTVRRVKKSEKNKLRKELEKVVEAGGCPFIAENVDNIVESYKIPGQKRLQGEDKQAAVIESLQDIEGCDADVAAWVASVEDKITEAFNAGKVKREVSPKAQEALAKYRAERAAAKA